MPRPRESSDEDLLTRVADAMDGAGADWSLQDAARAAGVHPATLIKRFGSRHGLLVALAQRWVARIPERTGDEDPRAELARWAAVAARPERGRRRALAGLAMLVEDLRDDELSGLLATGWQRQLDHLAGLVATAHRDGHLARSPRPAVAAALLLDVAHGALLRGAASDPPPGPCAGTLLDTLLGGWE